MLNRLKELIKNIPAAFSNAEKNVLSQNIKDLEPSTRQEISVNQNKLLNNLLKGELTQEVLELRARTLKVLFEESIQRAIRQDKNRAIIDRNDADGFDFIFIHNNETVDRSSILEKLEDLKENIKTNDKEEIFLNKNIIDLIDSQTTQQIKIEREILPKFFIENYIKQIVVKTPEDNTKRLLECYINKYPNPDNVNEKMLIKELKKLTTNNKSVDFLDFKSLEFATLNSMFIADFLSFKYINPIFFKCVEFEGHFIIKLLFDVEHEFVYTQKHLMLEELDIKYANKEKKENDNSNTKWL